MLNVKQENCESTFKVLWYDTARDLNPGLPTTRQMLTTQHKLNFLISIKVLLVYLPSWSVLSLTC